LVELGFADGGIDVFCSHYSLPEMVGACAGLFAGKPASTGTALAPRHR
jgi:hypothetical protein